MSQNEKFHLQWNDFQVNVSNSFTKLRTDSKFHDVTLVTSDMRQVSAHRLVLSACSEFFRIVFENNCTNNNPLIILENISYEEINLILDYIYEGEINIFQDHLDRFLEIAKKFLLNGLVSQDDNFKDSINTQGVDDDFENDTKENFIEQTKFQRSNFGNERSLKVQTKTFEASNSEVNIKFEELVILDDSKMFTCTICNKKMGHKNNMRKHIETHMTGLSYECEHCGQTFRLKNSFNKHRSKYHSPNI